MALCVSEQVVCWLTLRWVCKCGCCGSHVQIMIRAGAWNPTVTVTIKSNQTFIILLKNIFLLIFWVFRTFSLLRWFWLNKPSKERPLSRHVLIICHLLRNVVNWHNKVQEVFSFVTQEVQKVTMTTVLSDHQHWTWIKEKMHSVSIVGASSCDWLKWDSSSYGQNTVSVNEGILPLWVQAPSRFTMFLCCPRWLSIFSSDIKASRSSEWALAAPNAHKKTHNCKCLHTNPTFTWQQMMLLPWYITPLCWLIQPDIYWPLSIFTATRVTLSSFPRPYAVASTTFPKAPAPRVLPAQQNHQRITHTHTHTAHEWRVSTNPVSVCPVETPTSRCTAAVSGLWRCSCFRWWLRWSSSGSHIWVSKHRRKTSVIFNATFLKDVHWLHINGINQSRAVNLTPGYTCRARSREAEVEPSWRRRLHIKCWWRVYLQNITDNFSNNPKELQSSTKTFKSCWVYQKLPWQKCRCLGRPD